MPGRESHLSAKAEDPWQAGLQGSCSACVAGGYGV